MNTSRLPRTAHRAPPPTSRSPLSKSPGGYELVGPVRQAVLCARHALFAMQREDGSWRGRVRGDVRLASRLLFLMAFADDWDNDRADELANAIRQRQGDDGGWPLFPGGSLDVSASVEAYFALKLTGEEACSVRMRRARRAIRQAGGADCSDVATRYWLALLGQIPYEACPPRPPEALLWSRRDGNVDDVDATLAVLWAIRPQAAIDGHAGVRELFVAHPTTWRQSLLDRLWHFCERQGVLPLRRLSLQRIERELDELASDLSAWTSPWVTLAQLALGRTSTPRVDIQGNRIDTSRALRASLVSGTPASAHGPGGAIGWLRNPESARGQSPADVAMLLDCWRMVRDGPTPGYDALPPAFTVLDDDFASDLKEHGRQPTGIEAQALGDKLAQALIAQQRPDGGWSPQRRGPSTSCQTGIVLAALALWNVKGTANVIKRAVGFLRRAQQADGSWESASGVHFLHGTCWALQGLLAAGVRPDDASVAAGVHWLLAEQLPQGGWGEPAGATRLADLPAPSATQTAWALRALVAAGQVETDHVARAVQFLVESQYPDGTWTEAHLPWCRVDGADWYENETACVAETLAALADWLVHFELDVDHGAAPKLRLVGA